MGRRVQPRQIEGMNVHRANDVTATSRNMQFTPFATATPLWHVKKKISVTILHHAEIDL